VQSKIVVEQGLVGKQADGATSLDGTLRHELSPNTDLTRGRFHQAGEESQQCGLAGTVGSNHRQCLAWPEREVYATEYGDSPERALESTDLEQK
jgi:hypothetical protein